MKQKLVSISARIDKSSLDYLKKVKKYANHLDTSTVMRMILQEGIKQDKMERALELYSKGKLSLEGASKFSGMYIGEFLELLKERGIELNLTLKDYKEGLENLKKVW